jgi:hypothetical protein
METRIESTCKPLADAWAVSDDSGNALQLLETEP